jgi:hypothetical protein
MNARLTGAPKGFRLISEAFSALVLERYETELAALLLLSTSKFTGCYVTFDGSSDATRRAISSQATSPV